MGEDTGGEFRMRTVWSGLSHVHAGKSQRKAALSCRLHMSLQGLEWWIYNRTASYDNIVNAMETTIPETANNSGRPSTEAIGSLRKIFSWSSAAPQSTSGYFGVVDTC